MARVPRVVIEGGLYHVYNRVSSGEHIFADPEEAMEFAGDWRMKHSQRKSIDSTKNRQHCRRPVGDDATSQLPNFLKPGTARDLPGCGVRRA